MKEKIFKVLLLPVSSGTGHLQVAKALSQAFEKSPRIEVENIDILDIGNDLLRVAYRDMYADSTQNVPELYGYMYRNFNIQRRFESFQKFFDRLGSIQLFQKMESFRPDMVISLHPLAIEITDFWRRYRGLPFLHAAVVTDFEGHLQWVNDRVDRYFVGSELSRVYLQENGIKKDRIVNTGIPIQEKFEQKVEKDRLKVLYQEIMEQIPYQVADKEVYAKMRKVIFVAGSLQKDEVAAIVERLFFQDDCFYILVCGKNKEVYDEFCAQAEKQQPKTAVCVLQFVDNMHELMSLADVIISKPGGLTVSEALRKGLPFVVIKPIPGQEQENADYILENGLGLKANSLELLHYKVTRMLERNTLKNMKKQCHKFAKKHSADNVREQILQMLED